MVKRMLGPRPCRLQLVYKVLIFMSFIWSLLKLIRNLKLMSRLFFLSCGISLSTRWGQQSDCCCRGQHWFSHLDILAEEESWICWINECLTNQYRGGKTKARDQTQWIWNTTNGLANLSSWCAILLSTWCAIFCIWCRGLQLELLHYYVTYV